MTSSPVVIIGAGLGGLSCAIQCCRWGLQTVVLERASELREIGAGIQIPPNAGRVLLEYGILEEVKEKAVHINSFALRRYADGTTLAERPLGQSFIDSVGAPWLTIHRADYHEILLKESQRLGAKIMLDSEVINVDSVKRQVTLKSGKLITGNVIVGADGLWSIVRQSILHKDSHPFETGDLAYRATFTKKELESLDDPDIDDLCGRSSITLWMGPQKHCVFYPIRGGQEYNLVLLCPDNLPAGVRTIKGELNEMRESFKDWDKVIDKMLTCVPSVLKWKLMHHHELDTWQDNCTVLMGDACHPTLPYQAQGAAMAVEDGAVLGMLLGLAHERLGKDLSATQINQVLLRYEALRKRRTTINVQGAIHHRWFYHLPDGEDQKTRDHALKQLDWNNLYTSIYKWFSSDYQNQLLAHNVLQAAKKEFETWWHDK